MQTSTIVVKPVQVKLLYAQLGVQAATAAARTATSLKVVNGQAIAVAHSILVIAYYLIARQETDRDLGANYFAPSRPEATTKRLEQQGIRYTSASKEYCCYLAPRLFSSQF